MQNALPVPAGKIARLTFAFEVARRVQFAKGLSLAVQAFRMVWGSGNGGVGGAQSAYSEAFGYGRYGQLGTLPGSSVDFVREVGDPCHNAVVSIGLGFVKKQLREPRFWVTRRKRDGSDEEIVNHPLTKLIAKPGPQGGRVQFLSATAADLLVAGNAYWVKYRGSGGAGSPVQLAYVPYWEMAPQWPQDGSAFLTQYVYRPGGRGAGIPVAVENVVHFKADLNPYNQGRTARQPLYPLLREIYQDNESAEYESAITANMGIVAGMLSVDEPGGEIPKEARESVLDQWVERFTGSNRGGVIVPSGPMKYSKIGQSPAELGISELRDRPEDRICAALGLSAMVLGLTAGASAKTYANYDAALKAAYDNCILPVLWDISGAIEDQLLPDFAGSPSEACGWDLSRVACLADDRTELWKDLTLAVLGGWMRPDQARARAGVSDAKDAAGEEACRVYYIPKGAKPVLSLTDAAEQAHAAGELGNEGAAAATEPTEDEDEDKGGEDD